MSRSRRDRRRLLGLAGIVVAYAVAVGPVVGLPLGLVTAAVGYAVGIPYAVAVGHVLLLPVFPAGAHPLALAVVEAGFLGSIAADGEATPAPRRFAAVGVLAGIGLGALAWVLAATQPLALAAGVLLVAFGVAAYGVHRYGLLSTGAAGVGADARTATGTTGVTTETTDHILEP